MRNIIKKVFLLFIVSTVYLHAESMFLLTKMKNAYIVVENYSKQIPNELKSDIHEEMKLITDELKIDTTGYSYRSIVVMLYDTYIGKHQVLNIDLVVGEEVKRLDDKEDVYAFTYEKRKQLLIDNKDQEELSEEMLDAINVLLAEFAEQYKGDNI